MTIELTSLQIALIERSLSTRIFLEGPAGTGKTTVGVERLLYLMAGRTGSSGNTGDSGGVRADSILLLVPQRTLANPYYVALQNPGVVAGGVVSVLTVGGLAQRMVNLFWPVVAEEVGFAFPDEPPVFLTLESAQYYMARLVMPLLEQRYFDSVTIVRNRLYSQILDNLNKAAVVGFPHTEISRRLKDAWVGELSQGHIYDDAQDCANRFRKYCLEHNLLDFSLQLEVFYRYLWPNPLCRQHLLQTYHHLIVDNLEEDTPVAHDLLRDWLPSFDSALLIYDQEAGYRRFLGADPQSAYTLNELCDEQVVMTDSFVTSPELLSFGVRLARGINRKDSGARLKEGKLGYLQIGQSPVRVSLDCRYYPQMLDWVVDQIATQVREEQVSPGQIAILSPFLPDSLRFALVNRLTRAGIPTRSHRPSRALREEPAAQCLMTLAALAHPGWGIHPTKFDVAYALIQAIAGMDLVRAQLLVEIVYRSRPLEISSFDGIKPDVQERISYVLGGRYEGLRTWLETYSRSHVDETEQEVSLDYFLSRLFGEVLSQPGYGFHADFKAGEVAANLVESVRKFRWALAPTRTEDEKPLGQEYLEMVQDGVMAAQYLSSWQPQVEEAVLLAPASTFLMMNRPVDVQFWLDIGSRGWAERLYQPLTHPYVLSRQWPPDSISLSWQSQNQNIKWTDTEEFETSQDSLYRLALGLIRRCRQKVFLGLSQLSEQGYDQQGPLLKALQRVLREEAVINKQ